MTLTQIAKAFRDAIRDSAAIKNQCLATFHKVHSVWYGGGDTSSPTQEACPVFMVSPASKNTSRLENPSRYSIKVVLAIIETDPIESGGDSTEYYGSQYLETLLDLVWEAICQVSSNIRIEGEMDLEVFREFPVRMGELALDITVQRVLGGQQLEL